MQRFSTYRDFDWTLLTLLGILSLISVLEIKSATAMTKFHGFDHKQIGFLAGGLVLMFLISLVDYHRLVDLAPWFWGGSIVALIAVKLFGTRVLGGKRWIAIPHTGIHFQPSEWVKLVLILVLARFFWTRAGRPLTWTDIGKAFFLVGVPLLFVLKQPDLGTSLTYVPILVIGLFLGGISFRQASILIVAFSAIGFVAIRYLHVLKPYQIARLTGFADPDQDPKGTGYQVSPIEDRRRRRAASGAREPTTAPRPRATSSPSHTPTSSSPRSLRNMDF